MKNQPPSMTAEEKAARQEVKRRLLLDFLASGEVFTTADIVAELLECSTSTAVRTLESAERASIIKSEVLDWGGRKLKIWGLTSHGAAVADQFDAPIFELGKTNPAYVQHRLDGQRLHIRAARAGWSGWTPERLLRERAQTQRGDAAKQLKVPDAAATSPGGACIALEIERNCKTPKRYQQVIVSYLRLIKSGTYHHVHYVCPPGIEKLVERCFQRITAVKFAGDVVQLNNSHRARFHFFSFDNWPPAKEQANG